MTEELRYLRLEQIRVNPQQPRRYFADAELEELAESIKSVGLIQPPVVRPTENPDEFEIVSGERRYRASKAAGLKEIPVVIRMTNPSVSAQMALIENIQRVDLNALEIAKALRSLMEEFRFNQDEVAQRVGKKRSTIANYLRLLSLPKGIQDSLYKGLISMGHAKAILSLEGFEKQLCLHDLILRDSLSVREAEESAQRLSQKAKKKSIIYATRDMHLEQLEEKLQYKLGTKVSIQGKGRRGRISIDYFTLDDLDRLLVLLGIQNE
jgi:ParB family transcriptional regulator, chromosome partitioning protein